MTSSSGPVYCAFCEQGHLSSLCTVVTDVNVRKEALCKTGRCYVYLRKGHISRDCLSTGSCSKCRGRHHNTVCPRKNESATNPSTTSPAPMTDSQGGTRASQVSEGTHRPTNVRCVDSQTPILLQTARLQLYSPIDTTPTAPPSCVEARAIMDIGSQRTYITSHLRVSIYPQNELNLCTLRRFGPLKDMTPPVKRLTSALSQGMMKP